MCCLVLHICDFSSFPVFDICFCSIVIRKISAIWFNLWRFEHIFYCYWMECVVYFCYVHLVWIIVQVQYFVFDFLSNLFIVESGILKYPTITFCYLLLPSDWYLNNIFRYSSIKYTYNCYIFLMNWPICHYLTTFLISLQTLDYSLSCLLFSIPCSLLILIRMEYTLLFFYLEPVYVIKCEMSLLDGVKCPPFLCLSLLIRELNNLHLK